MPSNWEKIEQIYQEALGLAPDERDAFIQAATDGDEDLRREIESLLSFEPKAERFLAGNALHSTAKGLVKEQVRSLVGLQIGAYKIVSLLGAGGMGEVYKAVDTRLNRPVAIKFLLSHLSARPDLRKRFEREARSISNLNHPHICTLYDIGQHEGCDFLVMEYLEGKTLAEQLKEGCLPVDQVLRYALQIGDALAQAHAQGVIHRDLKPGNIMLTSRGAKLLDFGLAKLEAEPQPSGLTTIALAAEGKSLTAEGIILGTLEYMAPEQLEGKEADARTDIFSFGTVIYEMATGRKAFTGESKASVIVRILTGEPPSVTSLQPLTPRELEEVVQKCLRKEPAERWQNAAEVTNRLRQISGNAASHSTLMSIPKTVKRGFTNEVAGRSTSLPIAEPSITQPPNVWSRLIRSRTWKLSFVGILLAVVTASLILWRVRQQPGKPAEKPKEISLKPLTSYSWDSPVEWASISADGKYLAYCLKGKLFMQIIGSGEKRSIPLPDGFYTNQVFWFPDGTKLLLCRAEQGWTQLKGETTHFHTGSLWSISILGGTPQKLVDNVWGSSVSPDGSLIAFSRFDPERENWDTWLVNSNGEGPRKFRHSSHPKEHNGFPAWSPNGKRLFYVHTFDNYKGHSIENCDLRGEDVTTTFSAKAEIQGLCGAPDGRIFFSMGELSGMNLWEIMVDVATGRPLAEARRLTQFYGFTFMEANQFSITADSKQLVFLRATAQVDIYVAEAEAGRKSIKNSRRLTLNEKDDYAWDWTADSKAVLFESNRNGNWDLFKQYINQTDAETIVASPEDERHPNLSPDGVFILYLFSEKHDAPATRLMRVPVGGGPPELVLSGEKITNFSCAREANLCVVVEEVEGKQILTTFDPLKGRGEKLSLFDFPDFRAGILSPQGRLIEKMKSRPDGLYIRVRSLKGGPAEEITFKMLTGGYQFSGWSLDGKGIYVGEWSQSGFTTYFACLDGHSQVLWKRGMSPAYFLDYPIPSPDGRYIAFTSITAESNAWLLENF